MKARQIKVPIHISEAGGNIQIFLFRNHDFYYKAFKVIYFYLVNSFNPVYFPATQIDKLFLSCMFHSGLEL